MADDATLLTIVTPPGRGAIATLVVRGVAAIEQVNRHFSPASGGGLNVSGVNRIRFGRFRGSRGGLEEIVAVVTAADEVELHCHGGPAAVEAIASTLQAAGAERIAWQQEAEQRGEDRLRAEARVALAQAATERTCAILLDQYRGALGRELGEIETLAASGRPAEAREARGRLERLLDRWNRVGQHLIKPWRIVIAGPPNVGKSSLMNALLGYQRSIIYDQPGTTRDVLAAPTALDGWPLELLDTAGLRTPGDLLEAAGMERAREQLSLADGVLAVVDLASGLPPRPELPETEGAMPPVLWVGNKSDLLRPDELQQADWPSIVPVSAKTGAGLDRLCRALIQRLVGDAPEPGAAVPFLPRHCAQIQALLQRLTAGDPAAMRGQPDR